MNRTQHLPRLTTLLLLLGCLFFAAQNAQAQFRVSDSKNKKSKKEETPFKDKLWYGGGINLGFSAFNGNNAFGFGVSPMVGYKFNNWLSAGPRLSVFFTSQKYPGIKALNLFNTDAGIFLRARVFRGFFLQGELANQWIQDPGYLVDRNGVTLTVLEYDYNRVTDIILGIAKVPYTRFTQFIGAGYNFSNGEGGPGSEIGIFYNVALANDVKSYQNPLDYRFAFTWNF